MLHRYAKIVYCSPCTAVKRKLDFSSVKLNVRKDSAVIKELNLTEKLNPLNRNRLHLNICHLVNNWFGVYICFRVKSLIRVDIFLG